MLVACTECLSEKIKILYIYICICPDKWVIIYKISFCLHNLCVCCVYLLCIHKYTHIQYIFRKYLHVYIYIHIFYIRNKCIYYINNLFFWNVYIHVYIYIYIYISHITPLVIQFKKSLNAPHETWIQSSDLLLSCQLILREVEER